MTGPGAKINDLAIKKPVFVSTEFDLVKLLCIFTKRHSHLAFVKNHNGSIIGIATLEDILQRFIRREVESKNNSSINNSSRKQWKAHYGFSSDYAKTEYNEIIYKD